MAIHKTEAIILRTIPFRSSSLIVTFFTHQMGKVRGIAKGVRQERETRGAVFELFSQLEIIYYEKLRSDLHLVSDAFLLESYPSVRSRLETIAYASYFSELVDQLTEVSDPHPELFTLLDFGFRYLASVSPERISRIFEIKLLAEVGWIPYLDSCLVCHKRSIESGFFSPQQGALVCASCAPSIPDARELPAEALAALRYYSTHHPELCLKLPLGRHTEERLAFLMQRFFYSRLQHPLRTVQFLDKIKPTLALR